MEQEIPGMLIFLRKAVTRKCSKKHRHEGNQARKARKHVKYVGEQGMRYI